MQVENVEIFIQFPHYGNFLIHKLNGCCGNYWKGGAHCTEIDFALSFGAVLVKMIDWSKTESRDFFGIILGQENSQKLYLLPKSC